MLPKLSAHIYDILSASIIILIQLFPLNKKTASNVLVLNQNKYKVVYCSPV